MEIVEELPSGWVITQFDSVGEGENAIVDGPFGSNLKISDYIDDKVNGIPVLTTKNLAGDYSDRTVRFISKEKFETLKRSQVNGGDILVAKIGSIGKTGVYPKNARTAIIPANLLKFTVSRHIEFRYVYNYINSIELQNMIREISTATAQPAFNVTKFRKLGIPLPPLLEQQRIVAKIEELFSELDKGVENLNAARQQLKIYRNAVLKWAFEKETIEKVYLKDVTTKINDGTHKTPKYVDNGIPFISAKNVIGGKFEFKNCKYITQVEHETLIKRCNPEKGDVLLTKSGTIGRTAIVDTIENFSLFESVALLKPIKETVLSKYLMYNIDYCILTSGVRLKIKGVAVRHLHLEDIREIPISLPSLSKQDKIVCEIESRLSVCDNIEQTVDEALKKAESMRKSILKKAFVGKLVPQDPNDEPAEILLERIRTERDAQKTEKKQGKRGTKK